MEQHRALLEKKEAKGRKIGEMRRIWLNHDREPVESLFNSLTA